ncbi:MAG: type II toxin-antitoxin system RelE/ParE family toxin [Spirochaetaceae bacterium]|nr:type II toxin-antitoxin system RelE/ParE family toxin [Spirochaetaceae bacterium]
MDMYEVLFYDLPDGSKPVKDFMDTLDAKMFVKVVRTIDMLKQVGPSMRLPYSEHLDDGIFEIRVKQGTNITRVLYFFFVGKKIILTNGFVKKTQKTPKNELALAKKYRDEYKSRGGKK